jgi:hypothetical protein
MLGDLIANLNRPGVVAAVLTTLVPTLTAQIENRAAAEGMTPADFVTGAVRDFVERQMITSGSSCSPSCARLRIPALQQFMQSCNGS